MGKSSEFFLKKIFQESINKDVDELAYRPTGVQDVSRKEPKFKPIWHPENPTAPGSEGTPDAWVLNMGGNKIVVVPLSGVEEQEYIEKNQQWLEEIGQEHQGIEINLIPSSKTKEHPRNVKLGSKYVPTGEKYDVKEKIKRELNPIIADNFENDSFTAILNKKSIPAIKAQDRKFEDQYGIFTNERITYATHSFNLYPSSKDFLKAVLDRIQNKESEDMKTFYLARQFNQNYRNWRADKKNLKKYEGKTPVYKLEAFGLEEGNFDVNVRTDFEIKGENHLNNYQWSISMRITVGKKTSEESGFNEGFSEHKTFTSSKTVPISRETVFDDNHTVLEDPNIVTGLVEAINDIKSQVESYDIKDNLFAASVKKMQKSR